MTKLPPYALLLKLKMEERGDTLRFVMPFHDDVVGRPGFLHGGAIAGLLEFAAFTALSRAIGEGVVKKPITVTVDYMRGGTPQDTFAEARVERLGKRIANVEAYAWQVAPDKPIAAAQINFLLDRQ
jgi:uncharacterized protein (TIGR00369 family)